jgi:hypothetical protein
LARIFEAVACHLSGGDAARHFRFHALVYRSEPVAIVKEGLPALVIGMTWRGATERSAYPGYIWALVAMLPLQLRADG